MTKAAVFSDIDGTIWDFQHRMPESARGAFARLRENGHLVFLCSGRAKGHIIDDALLSLPVTGMIAACGTYIEAGGEILFEQYLPREVLEEAMQVLRGQHMPFILEGKDYHWLNPPEFAGDFYVERLCKELGERVRTLDQLSPSDQVNKLSAVTSDSSDLSLVKRILSSSFRFYDHGGKVVELVPADAGKEKGMERVCKLFGIPHDKTYAIGDSINDLDMLTYAAHGICMGDGKEEAKQAAAFVTDALHEDGFLHAMEHFGLI